MEKFLSLQAAGTVLYTLAMLHCEGKLLESEGLINYLGTGFLHFKHADQR